MLSLAFCCALAAGWCAGGRLSRFEGAGLRWLVLPVLSLLLQALSPHLVPLTGVLVLFSYLLLLLFLWKNRALRKTALFAGLGSLCNALVIAANGFRMPVAAGAANHLSPETAAQLIGGEIPMYTLAGDTARLLFLGDVLYCPIPFFEGFASVGDILLALGIFFCLMRVMSPSRLPRWLCSG